MSKAKNLIIQGTKIDETIPDTELVMEIAKVMGLEIEIGDINTKRIGRAHETTNKQVMIVTFTSPEKRMSLLKGGKNLKDTKFQEVYISPDLTKVEQEQQFYLRQERRRRRTDDPTKTFIIRDNKVIEKKN